MDAAHKVEYKIRDLSTRSVVLFPTRALVTRDIKDVHLKPGLNEIVVSGLSPTVDEHSIKVEGSGIATITDIAIESLPNRELFQDVYPSDADDMSEDDDSARFEEDESLQTPEDKAFDAQFTKLSGDLERAEEAIANAQSRQKILDAYGKGFDRNRKKDIQMDATLEMFKQERAKAFEDRIEGHRQSKKATGQIAQLNAEQRRFNNGRRKLIAKSQREKARVRKTKEKERLRRLMRKEEREKEKLRIFQERLSFWPKYCYSVRIQLDVNAFTPMSSRRTSISSEVELAHRPLSKTMDCEESPTCDLVLSYVTTSAFWSPSYDLQLSTTNAAGSLCFDARLNNSTSETWANCKITLSTSETDFSGIDDSAPTLVPWQIRLAGKGGSATNDTNILNSREENEQRRRYREKRVHDSGAKPRSLMFGIDEPGVGTGKDMYALVGYNTQLAMLQNKQRLMAARQGIGNSQQIQQPQMQQPQMQQLQMFQPQMQMQQQQMQQQQQQMQIMRQDQAQKQALMRARQQQQQQQTGDQAAPDKTLASNESESTPNDGLDLGDTDMFSPEAPVLDFAESLIEETGLTTTYDLPGTRTLVPKARGSKQRVARVNFANVFFSHTIVAKYKPAAHLKAKLKNNSKLTLLKGPASLMLDGSFMGRTDLPRCSAGDTFLMNLGVDPAIKVVYPKAEVRRSTSGMFSKEDSSVYVRAMTVRNSRATAGKPVTLLVLDQIPTSEDERLRVELVNPSGLSVGGHGVAAGAPGREVPEDTNWGKATAYLNKGGQVAWDVKLNAGKAVKLALEYSVSLPSGEVAMEC